MKKIREAKLLIGFVALCALPACNSPKDSASTVAGSQLNDKAREVLETYAAYESEIANLGNAGITFTEYGEYKVARGDFFAATDAKSALETRIKNDKRLSGDATSGQKGDLLAKSQQVALNPQSTANRLNQEVEWELSGKLMSKGQDAFNDNSVTAAIIALKGMDAYRQLSRAGDTAEFNAARNRFFSNVASVQ